MRIAMWSGPRNLSTAMMYAFGNRADVGAVDEPFYAAYLAATGADHPMAARILASQPTKPNDVADGLERYKKPVQYEKHMVHHMLPEFPLDWLGTVQNVILLRHPARVLASYLHKRAEPTAEDLGFPQIRHLYDQICDLGLTPVVIDSADVRSDPAGALEGLCRQIGIAFDPAMLNWPAGPKPFDGIWAAHWYDAVHQSTGFGVPEASIPSVPPRYARMIDTALETYSELKALDACGK